jgi:hypothetical protein
VVLDVPAWSLDKTNTYAGKTLKLEDIRKENEKNKWRRKRRRRLRNRRYLIRENSRREGGRSRTNEQERE